MTLQQLEVGFQAWIEYIDDCDPPVDDGTWLDFQTEWFQVPGGLTDAPPRLQLMGHLACRATQTGADAAKQTLQRLAGNDAGACHAASLHELIDAAAGAGGSCGSHLRPSRVAALALAHVDPLERLQPASLQEQLVKVWLTEPRHFRPAVSLPALLVADQAGIGLRGQPARIDFWLTKRAHAGTTWQAAPCLLRAPAFSMLPADWSFESGLQAVNLLLAHLVCADAPAVAFAV